MGYECSFRFYCKNEMAPRLRAGLGSLLIAEAGRTEAILGDGSVVALKSEWKAAQPPPAAYALVPLGDLNIRENWFFHFEDGDNEHGSPAFDYAPPWLRGTPLEWFGVLAALDVQADREHTALTVRPCYKDMAIILSQDIVRRFYRRMAFESGALLGYFSDDYSDTLFSAEVVLSREMHASSRDAKEIDRFVGTALQALSVARSW
jgi:hypothetical protein